MGQAVVCNRTVIKLTTAVIYSDDISGSFGSPFLKVSFRYNGISASINRKTGAIEKIRIL